MVLLKDVFAEDDSLRSAWKEGLIARVGILNWGFVLFDDVTALTACFPFKVFVNFDGFPEL